MIVFFNGNILPLEKVKISPFDRGFMFADGVYEAIRTYNKKLFKYREHKNRLQRNLDELNIKYSGADDFDKIIYELISRNKMADEALAYIQITRGVSQPRIHHFPSAETLPTIFIYVTALKKNREEQQNGIKVILLDDTRWTRCDIKSISLLPNVLSNQKAFDAGAEEAILVEDGIVTEGTRTSFFAIEDNQLTTSPLSNFILGSITRDVVIDLCKDLDIKIKEEYIEKSNLKNYNGFFIASTTKEITPIVQIDKWVVGDGKPGKVVRQLQKAFNNMTKNYQWQ